MPPSFDLGGIKICMNIFLSFIQDLMFKNTYWSFIIIFLLFNNSVFWLAVSITRQYFPLSHLCAYFIMDNVEQHSVEHMVINKQANNAFKANNCFKIFFVRLFGVYHSPLEIFLLIWRRNHYYVIFVIWLGYHLSCNRKDK